MRRVFFIALTLVYSAGFGLFIAYLCGVLFFGAKYIAGDRLHLNVYAETIVAIAPLILGMRMLRFPDPPRWLIEGAAKASSPVA